MADLIRSVTSRLRKYVGDRRRASRREARFEASLPFTVSLLGEMEQPLKDHSHAPSLPGLTRDISERCLTLLLPSSRIRSVYLTVSDMYLGISPELPAGAVGMIATSVRFEQLSVKESGYGYLLGARIVEMRKGERERYLEYLSTRKSRDRRAPGKGRPLAARALSGRGSTVQINAPENLTPQSLSGTFEKFLRERKS